MGDNIYALPFVRLITQRCRGVQVQTPWPQWFVGLGVEFAHPGPESLRTQAENIRRVGADFEYVRPRRCRHLRLNYMQGYDIVRADRGTILDAALATCQGYFPAGANKWDLDCSLDAQPYEDAARAECQQHGICCDGETILVRYPTVRKEWPAASRNPPPGYVHRALEKVRRPTDQVVEVSWLKAGEEWCVDPHPEADVTLTHGELSVETIAWLASRSRAVVCSPCYLLPMALAVSAPLLCVFGGHVSPKALIDPIAVQAPTMAISSLPFCHCIQNSHKCDINLTIEEVEQKAERFAKMLAGWVG